MLDGQRSLDELGTPLADVTFCVVDLETTGASPATCQITEIGAVKYRGGERVGEFATLVNPGQAIPPEIVLLTGITEAMVAPAPPVDEVLPTFVEFARGCVLVGHNLRFDSSFLDSALRRSGYDRLDHPMVCTAALARRLVANDVPNCKLKTLATHFRCPHQPTHRALADAEATADLLHGLLEHAGTLGVFGLGDLLELPKARGRAHYKKIHHTRDVPRLPGVYRFIDGANRVIYVGKARDLRARVRSYFYGDTRRKIAGMLREMAGVEWTVCATELEAEVHEVREIAAVRPRYNARSRHPEKVAYLALTLDEAWPRLMAARRPLDDGRLYVGPLPSLRAARDLVEIVQDVLPLRRCGGRLGRTVTRLVSPCSSAQLGRCQCPCSGSTASDAYWTTVAAAVRALGHDPDLLLGPLEERMWSMAAAERYEEAALARDRLASVSAALRRHHRLSSLVAIRRLVVQVTPATSGPSSGSAAATSTIEGAAIARGRLVAAWRGPQPLVAWPDDEAVPGGVASHSVAEEASVILSWLERHAATIDVVEVDGELALPIAAGLRDPRPARVRLGKEA